MTERGRSVLAVAVAIALVVSTPISFLGVAGGTHVSAADGSGGKAVYPGQTVAVVNVSVGSEDDNIYSAEIEPNTEIIPFEGANKYGYINDGTSSENYQQEDDVLTVKGVDDGTDIGKEFVYKFNNSIAYIDDLDEGDRGQLNKYDGGDDIYSIEEVSGDAYLLDTGVTYSTFQNSDRYLSSDPHVDRFQNGYPIVSSDDGTIGTIDSVKIDGSDSVLDNIPSEFEHYNDQDGTARYDPSIDGLYGEPIYISGGDGEVNSGEDTRLTQVSVFSGFDDGNISTINLNQQSKAEITSSGPELGVGLSEYIDTPSINEIDPDGSENSAEGVFGPEDSIVIDTNRDGYYDKSEDIAIQGNPTDGDPYTEINILGEWRYGYDETDEALIVFDKGNNTDKNEDDLIIQRGSLEIDNASKYSDTYPQLKYWDNDESSTFNPSTESTYFDVGTDSQGSGEVESEDFRLTHFTVTYEAQTVVTSEDIDSGTKLDQFLSDSRFIDDDSNEQLDNGEIIVKSDDKNLDSSDEILVKGSISQLSNQFSSSGSRFDLHHGDAEFSGYEPVISVKSEFSKSSGDYNTNELTPGEETELNGFGTTGLSIEGYYSNKDGFEDGDEAVRLEWFDLTSGEQIDVESVNQINLSGFSPSVKFESGNGGYQDGKAIVKENDSDSGLTLYGDRLTALTVQNTGTLSTDAIESVALHQDDTKIASTTTAYDGVWTLEPDPDEGVIPTGEAATNFSVTATLSPDAPSDETLDFEVSPVEDDGLGGVFDTGDRGMFFVDGPPVGGINSGLTYTVADADDITAEAIAFQNPDRDGATAIELAFTDTIDPETTAPDDFTVETVTNGLANVTEVVDDGDGRVVLVMESGVPPSTVESVSVATGGLAVESGAAVPAQTLPVDATSVTIVEADERPHVVHHGERVAVLANEGGGGENGTPNLDETVRIEADTTSDGSMDELWALGSTGESSLLTVLDTSESNATAYRVTFQSDDGDAGETVTVPVENLSISVTANRTNTTDVAGPIGATVSASSGDRAIEAELLEAGNDTVLDTRAVVLDSEGDGVVEFPPQVANVSMKVTDIGTGVSNRTENVTVRKGYPGATFDREVFEEERGDVAGIGIRLVDTENATISIGSESVNYHERITVVDRDGNGYADLQVNTHRAGSGSAGMGIGLGGTENQSVPNDRVADVRREAPVAKGLSDPLETGNYTLEATVDGKVTDVAVLNIVDRATAGASTLVAPAGVDLDDPGDIENWTTQRETVAVGDQAVIAVDATGIDGFLNDSTDLRRGSAAAARTGAYVDIRRGNPPQNRPARGLNVSNASTLVDGERDGLYVVIPSDGGPYAIEAGEEFDATFVLNETSPYVAGGPESDGSEPESAETTVAFEAPDGRFTGLNENESLELRATANATIAGETNVAPGTTVRITIRSDDDNVTFQESDEETVEDDGTFEGSVDLEEYPEGTEYTVVATANDDELTAVRTGSVVEEPITVDAAQEVAASGQPAGGGGDDDDEVTTTDVATATATSAEPTTEAASGGSVGERAATFVTRDVPEFIRTQETNIVIVLGAVAFIYGLVGLRRLTR